VRGKVEAKPVEDSSKGNGSADETRMSFPDLAGVPNCPPTVADAPTGTFYACHEYDPPEPCDFRTAAQKGPNVFKHKPECDRRANSINRDLDDARAMKERYEIKFQFISEATIETTDGVVKPTPNPPDNKSHHSFWVCSKTSMRLLFKTRVK
jgi:hypothetical protein